MKTLFIEIGLAIVIVQLVSNSAVCQQLSTPETQPVDFRTDAGSTTIFVSTTATNANTRAGYQSGQNIGNGSENTYLGFKTGFNSKGNGNLFMGAYAGYSNANSSASNNTFIGQRTGYNNSDGFANIFLGSNAGYSNLVGNYNTFIGNSAGQQNQYGSFNTFIGNGAGYNVGSANYNLFMGSQAGFNTVSGNYNVMLGQDAGLNNRSGNNNVFIGWLANSAGNSAASLTNAIAIGANAQVSASNALILGSGANVGIGTSAPNNKLEIVSATSNTSGLRLTNMKSTSPVTIATAKYLTVDVNGDVVLGSASGSGRVASEDANWMVEGIYLKNANAGGVIIGPGVQSTPTGYRLYVADGILTEKVKVAVKSTNDWSDRVFEDSYHLRTLNQVEQFINRNKHLPGVPSAQEVVAQGVDVGQIQAKLLEKVEELTLYVIGLERKSMKQQLEINKLKRDKSVKK
jgi:hypothetical protein